MSQTDLEYWLLRTTDEIKAVYNTKLALVESLKAADDTKFGLSPVTLGPINDKAFFYQDFGIEAANYDCFILFKWGSAVDLTAGGQGSETVNLVTTLYIGDNFSSDSEKHARRILRYRRALKASLVHAYHTLNHQGFTLLTLPDGLYNVTNRHMWAIPIVAEFNFAG